MIGTSGLSLEAGTVGCENPLAVKSLFLDWLCCEL